MAFPDRPRFARVILAAAFAAAGALTFSTAVFTQEQESDDATARRRAQYQWYNDSAPDPSNGRAHRSRPFSPGYQRFLNEAAARERTRYASQLPSTTSESVVQDATTPGVWANLGPTGANFLKNGGITLNVTDTGRVRTILTAPADPNVLYVAFAGGGVWKSLDGGATWAAKTEALGTLSIGALAMDPVNPQILYLGLGDPFDGTGIGLVKSIDGGDNWSAPVYLGSSTTIASLAVAPAPHNSIVMAATDKGLFRSTDSGATWNLVALGAAPAPHAWSIESAGGTNFVASLEANSAATSGTTDGQIWRSTDNGATWTRATGITNRSGIGRMTIGVAASNPQIMYALAALPNSTASNDMADVFKSVDNGVSWTGLGVARKSFTNANSESRTVGTLMRGQGWYDQLVLVDPLSPNVAYFGGALLLAKTSDGGSSFTQITNWLAQFGLPYVHADFHAGHFAAGAIYVGTDGGIFKSTNGGGAWDNTLNKGLVTHLLYNVGSSPAAASAVIGGMQDNGTRLRSGGTSIFDQVLGGDGFGCDVNKDNAQQMLGSLYYGRIYKSTDAGATFTLACSGIRECGSSSNAPFFTRVVPWPGNANTVFTAEVAKVYKSTNYAGSWTALGKAGLPSDLFIRNFGVSPTNVNRMGIVASAGRVFLSNDGGANWTLAGATPNNGLSMSSVAFDPGADNVVFVTSVAPDAAKSHIWRSVDGGATWTSIDGNGLPAGVPINAAVKVGSNLYAAAHFGVYVSVDDGGTWTRWGSAMPLVNVTDLNFSNPALVRAASYGRGFWEIVP